MPRLPKRANLYAPQGFGGETIGVCTTKRHTRKQVSKSQVTAAEALKNMVSVNTIGGIGKGFSSSNKRGGGTKQGEKSNELVCNINANGGEVVAPTTVGNIAESYAQAISNGPHSQFDESKKQIVREGAHTNLTLSSPQFTASNDPTIVANALQLDNWITASTMMWNTEQNPIGENMMPYVWNQGQCACCWVFATSWSLLTCATIQSNYWGIARQDESLIRKPQSINIPYLMNASQKKLIETQIPGHTCACGGGFPLIVIDAIATNGILSDNEAKRAGYPKSCFSVRNCGCKNNGVKSAQQTCSICGIDKECPELLTVGEGKSNRLFGNNVQKSMIDRFGVVLLGPNCGFVGDDLSARTLKAILVNIGPVFVGVFGSPLEAMNYNANISQVLLPPTALKPSGKQADHSVQIVGWFTYSGNGKEYWVVQNEWGINWGFRGCVLVEIPSPDYDVCQSFFEIGFMSAKAYLNEDGTPTMKDYNSPMPSDFWTNQPCGVCPE
jgi:hypothetical protein